jgi:pimeloyl-ACP methyl ester carboxylesterase
MAHSLVQILTNSGRAVAFGVALLALQTGETRAQLNYDHTDFLHGYASSGAIWTSTSRWLGASPRDYLARAVVLRMPHNPSFDSNLPLADWRAAYADSLAIIGSRHAAVGHSLGVLLARSAYLSTSSGRASIGGIVAVAAPHQGTILADSAGKLRNYFADLQRRLDDVEVSLGIFRVLLRLVTYVAGSGSVRGTLASELIYTLIDRNVRFSGPSLDGAKLVPILTVLNDMKPGSATIAQLNSDLADAAIPRANVTARIGLQHAGPKVFAALLNIEEAEVISEVNRGKRSLRKCKRVLWVTIIGIPASVTCGRAEALLKRLDDTYGRYVNGSQLRCFASGRVCVNVARDLPFDGVVSNERQRYPGLNDPFFDLLPLDGLNHQNIYKVRRGADQIAEGMLRIGMQRQPPSTSTPPLGVSLIGPDVAAPYEFCTWHASPSGGTEPYSYAWYVNGSPVGGDQSTLSYTVGASDISIEVSVTDAAGRLAADAKYVTVSSGVTCYY